MLALLMCLHVFNLFSLNIRRDHILADAFKNIMRETVGNLQSKKYNVKWVEEAT